MTPALCRLNAALPDRARSAPFAAHLAGCLRCQANVARSRIIRRELAALGGEVNAAPPYLLAAVLARLGSQADRSDRRGLGRSVGRYAAVAGVSAAAAAAVAAGMVLRHTRPVG